MTEGWHESWIEISGQSEPGQLEEIRDILLDRKYIPDSFGYRGNFFYFRTARPLDEPTKAEIMKLNYVRDVRGEPGEAVVSARATEYIQRGMWMG